MAINEEPEAIRDLLEHVLSGRASVSDIDTLIFWLQQRRLIVSWEEEAKKEFERNVWKTYFDQFKNMS